MRWRPRFSASSVEVEEEESILADPTAALLEQVGVIHSRVPWIPLGLFLLIVLWMPSLPRLEGAPMTPPESAWIQETLAPWDVAGGGSAFSRTWSRATWEWQGTEIEPGRKLTPEVRRAVRIPSAAASIAGLVVFYLLARLVAGSAAALLAATMLAICPPWERAGTSALPLIVGEMLVLLGVAWALILQARHREVEVAGVTATRISLAGVFLGIGLLLTPAAFATFLTTILIWFSLGLRRSRSEATTLPVESPGETTFLAVYGTFVLFGSALLAAWVVEWLTGGRGFPFHGSLIANIPRGVELWPQLYRSLLSPGPTTDWLIIAAFPAIFLIRLVERGAGRPWHAAGLLPGVFLGAYQWGLLRDGTAVGLDVPITVPPLFVLGFGWMILRGLHIGRIRRQEYTFVLVWLVMGVLLVPFVPAAHRHDPLLAAMVTLLPPVLVVAGRATRALWESEEPVLARLAIFAVGYLPVVLFAVAAAADLTAAGSALQRITARVQTDLPKILLGAVVLGVLSEFFTVRPDLLAEAPRVRDARPHRRRGRRGGRRRRGGRPGAKRRSRGGS